MSQRSLNLSKILTLKQRIKTILEVNEHSRNSDASLVANYWYCYEQDKLISITPLQKKNNCRKEDIVLPLSHYYQMTQPSVIERVRRLIQQDVAELPEKTQEEKTIKLKEMLKYFPTDDKVLSKRKLRSRLWKTIINEHKIKQIINEQTIKQVLEDLKNNA